MLDAGLSGMATCSGGHWLSGPGDCDAGDRDAGAIDAEAGADPDATADAASE